MTQAEIRALEHAGRSSAVWSDVYDSTPRFGEVAKALLPAAFILTVATALLVSLL